MEIDIVHSLNGQKETQQKLQTEVAEESKLCDDVQKTTLHMNLTRK